MFFCDKCANKNGWPTSMFKSHGPCEICNKVSACSDIASSLLPLPRSSKRRKSNDPNAKES